MEVEKITILKLNEAESFALKKLLGNINDEQFKQFEISGDDRQTMTDIYNCLDYPEEDID